MQPPLPPVEAPPNGGWGWVGGEAPASVQCLRGEVRRLAVKVGDLRCDLAAMQDALEAQGLLRPVQLLVHLHRRRFRDQRGLHGGLVDVCWADVLATKELALSIGRLAGPSAMRGVAEVARAPGAVGAGIFRLVRDTCPGDIFVSGGNYDGVQGGLNSMSVLRAASGEWEELPSMSLHREFASAGVLQGCLYVCGGRAGAQPLSSAEKFDPEPGAWSEVPDMSTPRAGACAGVLAGRLHVCGGWRGKLFFPTAEAFDPKLEKWSAVPPMREKRGDLAVACAAGHAYAVGGYDGTRQLDSVERFDPFQEQWHLVRPMGERRMGMAAAAIGGRIFVCGGSSGRQALSSAECYDPRLDSWEALPGMSVGRFCTAAASTGGKLYVFGGMFVGRCLDTAEFYDPVVNSWSPLPSMSARRTGAAVAAALR